MNIVIEGPDGTGKSTLAKYIAREINWPIVHSPGPSASAQEFNERVRHWLTMKDTIFDRHPVVSEYVYGRIRGNVMTDPELATQFHKSYPLIIYCKQTLKNHVVKDHDTPEHLDMIQRKDREIRRLYDSWGQAAALITYRHWSHRDAIIRMVKAAVTEPVFTPLEDVIAFLNKFQLGYYGRPRVLPFDLQTFRLKHMREELNEYERNADAAQFELDRRDGLGGFEDANLVHHLEGMVDALLDLIYLATGTAMMHGFRVSESWRRIHAANMTKELGDLMHPSSKFKLRLMKPEGWEAPKHTDLVENHAYRGQS